MKVNTMSAETAAGLSIGLKSGLIAAVGTALVAILTVLLGFAMVPLAPGREMLDAVRRLAAGLFCSFTLGPLTALKFLGWFPELMNPWLKMFPDEPLLLIYFISAVPFIAVSGLVGFWVVAAVMAWFTKRAGKDVGELLRDAKADVSAVVIPPPNY
jgi:xanthosine utilization system XapX-like protein